MAPAPKEEKTDTPQVEPTGSDGTAPATDAVPANDPAREPVGTLPTAPVGPTDNPVDTIIATNGGTASTPVVEEQQAAPTPPAKEAVPKLDSRQLLEELLDDAKRVAAYGQRTGRLPDSELFFALAATEGKAGGPIIWDDPAIISLQGALNRAVTQIYPTTLADLRDPRWHPFAPRPEFTLGHMAFVIFSLLLMGFSAFWTVQYNLGNEVIRGVQQLQKEDPRAEIGAIVRQLLRSQASAGNAQASQAVLAEEAYFKLIDRLHAYDARFDFYAPQVKSFLVSNRLPHELLALGSSQLAAYLGIGDAVAATRMAANDPAFDAYDACAVDAQGTRKPPTPLTTEFAATTLGTMLSYYVQRTIDVLCAEGVHNMPFLLPDYQRFLQQLQQWSTALGMWYLPALYGMLGATLFYMRRVLDPTVPDPPLTRVLHRLALGAFAGVIITWFWIPNSELAEGFTSIGLTLFTLAFLVGFCVDVLFALLDRVVTLLLDLVKGVNRQAKPTIVSGVVLRTDPPRPQDDPKPAPTH